MEVANLEYMVPAFEALHDILTALSGNLELIGHDCKILEGREHKEHHT